MYLLALFFICIHCVCVCVCTGISLYIHIKKYITVLSTSWTEVSVVGSWNHAVGEPLFIISDKRGITTARQHDHLSADTQPYVQRETKLAFDEKAVSDYNR